MINCRPRSRSQRRCGCGYRPYCPPPRPPVLPLGRFTLIKQALSTLTPLPGAVYTLSSAGQPVLSTVSDIQGRVTFTCLQPGIYELEETLSPPGFQATTGVHTVVVSAGGQVTVDGKPAVGLTDDNVPSFIFAFRKRDTATGQPLPGATFSLMENGTLVASITSDAAGLVNYGELPPGTYTLEETAVPPGYILSPHIATVVVDDEGNISVDGIDLSRFAGENIRLPGFLISKVSGATGDPLAGAEFTLMLGGVPYSFATSDSMGMAGFESLPPGTYSLVETTPPAGYQPNPTPHAVVVDAMGNVTVDGVPVPESGFLVTNIPQVATIVLIHYDITDGVELKRTILTVAPGMYGPYAPEVFPGFLFVGLASGSAPVTGTIAADETLSIIFNYVQDV